MTSVENVKEEKRTFMSKIPFKEFKRRTQPISDFKPKGLWYSCNGEWEKWVKSEEPEWWGKYHYTIELNLDNIRIITNFDELKKFTEEFSSDNGRNINWRRVALQYSGIEISPVIGKARLNMEYPWYYGWDVASGCIWKKDAIKNVFLKKENE
jgi:hypothetical protein